MRVFVAGFYRSSQVVEAAEEYGLGIEIQDFSVPDLLDRTDHNSVEALRDKLAHINDRSLHGTFSELFPGSRDAEVRATAKRRFQKCYELALELGMQHLILHHAFSPGRSSQGEDWKRQSTEFWKDFLVDKDGAVQIHLENTYEEDHYMMADLIDAVDTPFFSICLDIGHCNAFSGQPIQEWIKGLKKRIGYVHLHNNHGETDEHLGLLDGTIDMAGVLSQLGEYAEEAVCTIETIPAHIVPSINWLSELGIL